MATKPELEELYDNLIKQLEDASAFVVSEEYSNAEIWVMEHFGIVNTLLPIIRDLGKILHKNPPSFDIEESTSKVEGIKRSIAVLVSQLENVNFQKYAKIEGKQLVVSKITTLSKLLHEEELMLLMLSQFRDVSWKGEHANFY